MRVKTILQRGSYFIVTLEPNWFEKLFIIRERNVILRSSDYRYTYGGQNIYIYEDGRKTERNDYIAKAIDMFINRQIFNNNK